MRRRFVSLLLFFVIFVLAPLTVTAGPVSFTSTPNPVYISGAHPLGTLTFDPAASASPDPLHPFVQYTWNFGDGSPSSSNAGGSIVHNYSHIGAYGVGLTAQDNSFPPRTYNTSNVIGVYLDPLTNQAPVASAGGPYSIITGATLKLNASSSTDADTVVGDFLTFAWDLNNDGAFDNGSGSSLNVPFGTLVALHVDALGSHTIRVRATDTLGVSSIATTSLLVRPVPEPSAAILFISGTALCLLASRRRFGCLNRST